MNTQVRQVLALLALVLVVVFTIEQGSRVSQESNKQAATRSKPNAFASNAKARSFDGEGEARLSISSADSLYFEEQQRIELIRPAIQFMDKSGHHYQLEADRGDYQLDKEQIQLSGSVLVQSLNEQISHPEHAEQTTVNKPSARSTTHLDALSLRTEALLFDARERFISSEQAVTITLGANSLKAVGMRVALDQRNLKLLSRVKGRYVIDHN